ncbi:M20/M25/M40 family metallo-hydrolase [Leptobacterium flavescens]|uniref:Vacuolar membrane protease n=1 Tax=Leptobacterium flavescens TaxID=472055 RepID=A0A6P0US83_9FLAO|nr:M20/M25/M40 family metallo-hydrolase [Leptobacterium flavescens]NER15370.1 M20/M25/M40 family metallo-hydrolase [Leptobacterium flavescens]
MLNRLKEVSSLIKKNSTIFSLLAIAGILYWNYYTSMPQSYSKLDTDTTEFSTERALKHLKIISEKPHYVGSEAHAEVGEYLIDQLNELGLKAHTQEGYNINARGVFNKSINILARIEGREKGKALLLLSHYDSGASTSLGASDDGNGVVTILESVRAFLARGKQPKNDIIILFSDAEELGLKGAQLFVDEHPWAKNIGLVINFEARGSGGPSYTLMETNDGNKELIKHFSRANPKYPVANSLTYSIYKMLPNDTDLTVFRENGDIEGFNFAFIDDHFDYHTAFDSYDRLDRTSLEHQGTYLMPLISYFSEANLSELKNKEDYIFFNLPVLKLIYYPFSWIFPLLILAFVLFFFLVGYGLKMKKLVFSKLFLGFIPLLISLIICTVIGYFGWGILTGIYPHYNDFRQGFTYNGYLYIGAFVALCLSVCFWTYGRFKHITTENLLVAPVLIWLIINTLVGLYLKGAAYFIIPVIITLIAFYILIHQEKPNKLLLFLCIVPGLLILTPFLKMFPVALGLRMMVSTTLFTALIFGISLPVFGYFKRQKLIGTIAFVISLVFFIGAHFKSGFNTTDRAKPNSLVYILDADQERAIWGTYDTQLDDWVTQNMGDQIKDRRTMDPESVIGRYGPEILNYMSDAPFKNILPPIIEIEKDTLIEEKRLLKINISSQRNVNRQDLFINRDLKIYRASVNGVPFSEDHLKNHRGRLLSHIMSNNNSVVLELEIPKKNDNVEMTLYESSYDLLENPQFSVLPRPKNSIPMAFRLNDGIIVKKSIPVK